MKEIRDRYDVFLKVCETGSFSKAADALDYTQSGISEMMAGLEVQLFARAKKEIGPDGQRNQTASLHSGYGQPERKAHAGCLQYQIQHVRKVTDWMFYQCDGHVDAGNVSTISERISHR